MEQMTRRTALAAAGVLGLVAIGCGDDDGAATTTGPAKGAPAASGRCTLTPEQTEGPYYVADSMVRRDISEGRPGTPLRLDLTVQEAEDCEPVEGATVELWHCDAEGTYSGVQGDTGTFCRGAQRTNADGVATFDTIYPGWYQGRAVHIHVKVHLGGNEVHTGQLYFDDATSSEVFASAPYRGDPDTPNASDGIYAQGGRESTVALKQSGDGWTGTLTMAVEA